jgi:pilus assembly protein FimV
LAGRFPDEHWTGRGQARKRPFAPDIRLESASFMAFGFGFNKQKVLSAAEKFVQQGKLQNAIAEYEKVLKNDPKDLTVSNTIGDLYARQGDTEKAVECFKNVGDAYASQGFTVKGIAMYKKIAKLKSSVDSSLKLAELYTQQGLFNDARAQYLQIAEDFMKAGDLEQAVRLFQKVLEMDPENVPMRIKLAEVYLKLGKKKEAWDIFSAAAEALRARGSLAAAEDLLKRMMALDPGNSYVLLLRGKSALESDDPKSAIEYLEKASDIDTHPDALRDLLKAYLQIGDLGKAAPLAEKLVGVHNDVECLFLLAEGSVRLGEYHQALDVYTRHADRLLATDSAKLLATLHSMISHVREDAGALDTLLLLLNKAGDNTHVNEVTELLAHASVKDGNLTRARDLYQMLSTTEPENQMHHQNYQQMVGQLADSAPEQGITAEEGAVIVEELEAIAPPVDQAYPDDVAVAVRAAVTDADLFLSYNLPDKAVVPLLGVLSKAPRDARLNQRLAALHTRFHRFAEAAVCCRTLESIYHDAGYPDEAMRYGELAERYEQAAPLAPAAATRAVQEPVRPPLRAKAAKAAESAARPASAEAGHAPWPSTAGQPGAEANAEFAVEEMSVHAPAEEQEAQPHQPHSFETEPQQFDAQVEATEDAGSEWEDSLAVEEGTEVPPAVEVAETGGSDEINETVEEVRFYLEHFMTEQARSGLEKLETLTSDRAILDPLRAQIEAAGQAPEAEGETELEINADEPAEFDVSLVGDAAPELDAAPAGAEPASEIAEPVEVSEETAEPEQTRIASEAAAKDPVPARHQAAEKVANDRPAPQQVAAKHSVEEVASVKDPARGKKQASPVAPVHKEQKAPEAKPAEEIELSSFVADLEASLGDSFPQAPIENAQPLNSWPATNSKAEPKAKRTTKQTPGAEPVANAMRQAAKETVAATSTPAVAAASAGAGAGTGTGMTYEAAAVRPLGAGAQAMHPANGVDLSEMFGELKQELEEDVAAADDDPETHYNLGVAFREMGLLDEAIAELQKVCTALDRGHAFSQRVQTYTWLAQCFLDKGVPEAAIRWYEKALNIPGLDDEARLAINYELGSACETAQDKPAALRHFTAVYGSNIDYRDVAERIQALKS